MMQQPIKPKDTGLIKPKDTGLKLYSDIEHQRERDYIQNTIDLLYRLDGTFNNRFKDTISYLEGYISGSRTCESAIDQARWERENSGRANDNG